MIAGRKALAGLAILSIAITAVVIVTSSRRPPRRTAEPEATPPRRTAETVATPPAPPARQDQDLSGIWIFGSSSNAEPGATTVVVLRCWWEALSVMKVSQQGEEIEVAFDERAATGGVTVTPHPKDMERETLSGTRHGSILELRGERRTWRARDVFPDPTSPPDAREAVRLHLEIDPANGHLRGQRNGQPFWAVRAAIEEPVARCRNPPA